MLDSVNISFTIAIASVAILVYYIYTLFLKKNSEEPLSDKPAVPTHEDDTQSNSTTVSSKNKEKKSNKQPVSKAKDSSFRHRLLSTSLKAHSSNVCGIDFSSNGKYLISSGEDRAIFVWSTKEFDLQQHKNIRCNVEFDHALKLKFSPDSRSFIVALSVLNTIRAYKIVNKDANTIGIAPAAVQDFPQKKHKAEIISIGLSCNAKFIMTCSKDTTVVIWSLKGEVLGTIDTRLMNNSFGAVSACGRFFGVCGFTPDVKIWEVCFDKVGNFKEIKRAFELKGHSAGVSHFSFNSDSSKMVTVSKDQTWKLWDTNIDYERGQEATCLLTINLNEKGPSLIALSPDSYSVAVVVNTSLYFYDGLTGECDESVENFCNETVTEMLYSIDNRYLAISCDRQVKVFHNRTGHRVAIIDLENKIKSAKTQASQERLQQSIEQHKEMIEAIDKKAAQE